MSSKTMFAAAVAVVVGATLMITGSSFAASTPTPEPTRVSESRPPTAEPTPAPAETRATRPEAVRATASFTG